MKTRILSALAVLAAVTALSACGGKGVHSHGAGTAPAGAVVTTSPAAPGAQQPSASSGAAAGTTGSAAAGTTGGAAATGNPDPELSSLDQQLSGVDGALGSAAQSPSDDG